MLIDLLISDQRNYTFEGCAKEPVQRSFEKKGITCRMIDLAECGLRDYFSFVKDSPPHWILSFTTIIPHEKPLGDILGIPHFYWVENSLESALHFLNSQYGVIGFSDPSQCEQHDLTYVTHGVDEIECATKYYDVVSFADVNDHSALADIPQHIFGEHKGHNLLIKLSPSIHLHAPLPYQEKLVVLKASRMALLDPSSPYYWIAVAAGCLPTSPEKVVYYLNHENEREEELKRLSHYLPDHSWDKQIQRIIEAMS